MEHMVKSAWDEWEIAETKPLGKGGFGKVYKAVKKDSYTNVEMYSAIKIISIPSDEDEEDIAVQRLNSEFSKNYLDKIKNECVNEIELMINLRGMPNIIHIEDYKVVEKEKCSGWNIYIRMELLTGFADYIDQTENGRLTEKEIIRVGTAICSALEWCAKQPAPVIHRDIKPANILVSKSGDYVLSDFGIARRAERASVHTKGIGTERYIAPEVYNGNNYDAKADIYSLGLVLYELLNNGKPPFCNPEEQIILPVRRTEVIRKRLSGEILPPPVNASEQMAQVVLKACEFGPARRFQSASEFKVALETVKKSESKTDNIEIIEIIGEPDKILIEPDIPPKKRRKNISVILISFLAVIILFITGYLGVNFFSPTVVALEIEPQYVTLSIQQTSNLTASRIMSNGDIVKMNPNNLIWESVDNNIAQVDGNRILGINIGTTTINGQYQNNIIKLIVNVVDPMDGLTDVAQQYELGHTVKLFGGTTAREHIEHIDGLLNGEARFVSPGSVAVTDNVTIYVADSGILRRIKDNIVESIEIEPSYIIPNIVRCNICESRQNDVYILTKEWGEADGGMSYGIVKLLNDNTAEEIYVTDAFYTTINDFGFLNDFLYFIERNEVFNETWLKSLNLRNFEDIRQICKLAKGTNSLTFGENNLIYLANQETGVIQVYDGELRYFAGIENEKAFIDGSAPLFYMPQKIKYADNALYVWDYNTLRKIKIEDEKNIYCTTLAGQAYPELDFDIELEYNAESIILSNSNISDFAVIDGAVLLTDPKRGVIWYVK